MKRFHAAFSSAIWDKLNYNIKKTHSILNCTACAKNPDFFLKKYNQHFKNTKPVLLREVNETTPTPKPKIREQDVPTNVKRQIVKKAIQEHNKKQVKTDIAALYASNTSLKKWDEIRKMQHGTYTKSKERTHIGELSGYRFDKRMAKDVLVANCSDDKNLGKSMNGKWRQLAIQVNLSRNGIPATKLNATQVSLTSYT